MKIDSILQFFVVKEKRFFPLFVQSAENIKKASELLVAQAMEEDPDERRMYSHRIKEYETAGDRITDKIIDEVIEAYVTPFDRDDIHALAESMDSFLDCIRDSSKKIAIYQPKQKSKKLVEIAKYIDQDAECLVKITNMFEGARDNVDEMDALCDRMKEIEHIVDDIYESYMSNLFEKEPNPVEVIKKKNVIQAFEDTSDMGKVVSNNVRSIIVKLG